MSSRSRKARLKVERQRKAANTRAKYGPRGKPALVTVKRLDAVTGEVVELGTVDQSRVRGLRA